jgi:hypothetical protein
MMHHGACMINLTRLPPLGMFKAKHSSNFEN